MIVGIDEVGRGAWAGPLVVGAVLLGGTPIEGVTDSKMLTRKQREQFDILIRQNALAVGLGWVSARQIDKIGLSPALKLAARRAIGHIRHNFDEIVIDGTIPLLDDPRVTLMKKADLLVPSVSAASIVAKVARDNYMRHLDKIFKGYHFSRHVGYGTKGHRGAIDANGVTPIHRLSYMPLQKYEGTIRRNAFPELKELKRQTTRQIGDAGETEAVRYLEGIGHEIIARNWRTKYCEIDIISRCGDTIHFTEVKYRKSALQGDGLAAITPKKQRQMTFAAEFYAARQNLTSNLRLAVISVTGQPATVQAYLELG